MRRVVPLLVVILFAVACGGATDPTLQPPDAGDATPDPCVDLTSEDGAAAEIVMRDNEFDPTCVSMRPAQGLALPNRGENLHNLSLEGADVDLDVAPGEETRTEALGGIAPAGAVYTFFCTYHRDEGMEGQLRLLAN